LTLQLYIVKGQSEFIGIINPNTGTDNIIDSIPGDELIYCGVSTFDNNNHRFIFYGIDRSGNNRLYCINAITGAILSQASFTLNAGEFHYDNASNTLYTLYSDTGNILTLASIDINTAATTTITTLPVSGYGGGTTFFEEADHAYVIQNSGSFYSVNVNTGIITTTPAPTAFNELQFDNTTGIPYGFVMDGPSMYLVKINISNGTFVTIDTLPSGYNSIEFAFDEISHTYIYGNSNNLYSINCNTGIVSSTVFPVGINTMINFEMQYDNSSGILYSIQWGALKTDGLESKDAFDNIDFDIFPNPVSDHSLINFKKSYKDITISVYNSFGQFLVKKSSSNSRYVELRNLTLSSGIYLLSVTCDNVYLGTKKVIVE
jgi:hypothetical protein